MQEIYLMNRLLESRFASAKAVALFSDREHHPVRSTPDKSFDIELSIRPTVTAFGKSQQSIRFEYDHNNGTSLAESTVNLSLPKAENMLTDGTDINLGILSTNAFPIHRDIKFVLRTKDLNYSPSLFTSTITVANASATIDANGAMETAVARDRMVPARITLPHELPSGPFTIKLPVLYDNEPVGVITVRGHVAEEWSIDGKERFGIAITEGKCFPKSVTLVNADNLDFKISTCKLRESTAINVEIQNDARIEFVVRGDSTSDLRTSSDFLDLRVEAMDDTIDLSFPIKLMVLNTKNASDSQ